MSSELTGIIAWVKANELILGLLVSAIVITMPEKLPAFREFPEWMWEWTRDAMKTFMNFRHSGAPVTDTMHKEQQALEADPKALEADPKALEAVLKKKLPDPNSKGPQQLNG